VKNLVSILMQKVLKIVRNKHSAYGCHGFEHTQRVYNLVSDMGKELGANQEILQFSALLHDIARGQPNHAINGAKQAHDILKKLGMDNQIICKIENNIRSHSFSCGEKARTLEAQILADADKLDAMGAIGIYRASMYSVENERGLQDFIKHFNEKLLKLKNLMYTDLGRSLAEERHKFMLSYLKQLDNEIDI
jgi:uncharacterized protein